MNFKLDITNIPTYLDGKFEIFEIKQTTGHYPIEYLVPLNKEMPFNELSITDRMRYEFEQRDKKITIKVRIPQTREIDAFKVCKFGNAYHKVFNAFHFTNKEGFKETDLTFEEYGTLRFQEDL